MTNTKEQLQKALRYGDKLEDVSCYWVERDIDNYSWGETVRICKGTELPEREFSAGYGSVEGEGFIGYSKNAIYTKQSYDGAEWIQAYPLKLELITVRDLISE